jgi:glycerate 2-kinase
VAAALAARPDLSVPALIVAAGKAAAGMVRGAFASLPAGTPALVVVPHGVDAAGLPDGVAVLRGGHPHPASEGFESTARVLREVGRLGARDTLLVLVSGGASAVLEAPAGGVDPNDLVRTHELLVASGLAIADINLVRGCLSAVKAGRLAERARPARVVTLAISDVEGDDPRVIGSGPGVPPAASRRQLAARAVELLHAHDVVLPARIAAHIACEAESGDDGVPEDDADVTVVASIEHARRGARAELERRGYRVTADPAYLRGTTDAAAARVVSAVEAARREGGVDAAGGPALRAAVLGGETTVALSGRAPGRGGRNLDLAARLALAVAGRAGLAVAAAGTDGCDGSSRAAGAVVDGRSAARAEAAGFPLARALADFDTEPALDAAGDLVVTGPTGTNVGDLVVAVSGL